MRDSRRLLIILVALAVSADAQEREFSRLERELDYLFTIWPGEFDNVEQTSFDAAAGKADGAGRAHARFTVVDLAELGERVLRVEAYGDDEPATVLQNELYVVIPDESANALR